MEDLNNAVAAWKLEYLDGMLEWHAIPWEEFYKEPNMMTCSYCGVRTSRFLKQHVCEPLFHSPSILDFAGDSVETKNKHWVVGVTPPLTDLGKISYDATTKYLTRFAAMSAACRMAKNYPEYEFVVLETVGSYEAPKPTPVQAKYVVYK